MGLTSTWAHNLFVLWAFGFPTVGGSMLDRPKYTHISSNFSLSLTESLFCSLWVFYSFSLVFFPELPSSFFSSLFLIYSVGLVGMPWLSLIISGNDGPIPSCLSGCLGGQGGSGIGIDSHLQEPARQQYHLRQHREAETLFCKAITHLTKLRLIRCDPLSTLQVTLSRYVYWAHTRS